MYYFLVIDGNNNGIGSHVYMENPTSCPANEVPCTQDQANNPMLWTLSGKTLVENMTVIKANQASTIQQSFDSAVQSVPITINGTSYQISLAGNNPTINLSAATASQVLLLQSPAWRASAAVSAMVSFAMVNGSLLVCSSSGTTGTSAPTPPTAFGTPVTDGTAAWELYGRSFDLVGGGVVTLTAQEIINAAMQAEAYIHAMKIKREQLLAQIQAATTVSEVQAIVW